jgi:hypothetical protein
MPRVHDLLYVFEGCSKHGCKVGVSSARSLKWRIASARGRCQSLRVAKTWNLSNAFQIEQAVITVLSMSDRRAWGEEWFHVSCDEMLDAVGFAMQVHDHSLPQVYRMVCGHVSKIEAR